MSKSVQPIPPGHENLIPHLVCSPCSEAIAFYKKAFGAEEINRMPAPMESASCTRPSASARASCFSLMISRSLRRQIGHATALKGTPVTIHHYVENCDAAVKRQWTPAPR